MTLGVRISALQLLLGHAISFLYSGVRGRWTTDGQKGPLGVFEVFYILMLVVA